MRRLHFSVVVPSVGIFLIFSASLPQAPLPLFPTVITVRGVPRFPCVGAHGRVVGVASHGCIVLSIGAG